MDISTATALGVTSHAVNPFADYRRIWKETPPAITAMGPIPDTEQTQTQAIVEIR